MKSYCFALAALAAIGFAGIAYAGEATKPTPMTNEQMDQITAAGQPSNPGYGLFTDACARGNLAFCGTANGPVPGLGRGTACVNGGHPPC
jgi:hypothetical protein